MKRKTFTQTEKAVLEETSRTHEKCHVRKKALVVLNVARGHNYREIQRILDVSAQSIVDWVRNFKKHGVSGFNRGPGQGRKKTCNEEELHEYILQTPRNFGHNRNRWTLKLLAETVPSLKGFTAAGVSKALKRAGLSYKRGQPRLHSPDPGYKVKKNE